MAQPPPKRRRILRQEDIMRMIEESDSDTEADMLGQEDNGNGWYSDTDTESRDTAHVSSESEDDHEGPDVVLPMVLRNRRVPRMRPAVHSFDSCLDEDNYTCITLPE